MSTDLRPWSNFEQLVGELAVLQARALEAAARSVDEILTLRSARLLGTTGTCARSLWKRLSGR
jgi:hypothetical protein